MLHRTKHALKTTWTIRFQHNSLSTTIPGMLPRQVENIGGSIGIFLEKYRSFIGKNTQNIGVYRGTFNAFFTRTSHNFDEI